MYELVYYLGLFQLSTNITKSGLYRACLQGSALWRLGARWIIMQDFFFPWEKTRNLDHFWLSLVAVQAEVKALTAISKIPF